MNKDKLNNLISDQPSGWLEKARKRAKETTISKEEAIAAMKNGKRVYHRLFQPEEYIYMKGGEWIYDEDGYWYSAFSWWKGHNGEVWETGWKIMDCKINTENNVQ